MPISRRRTLPRRLWFLARDGLLLHVALERVPPRFAAFIDRFRPSQREPFGGPMNGQPMRRALVEQILASVPFDAIVETGTFRGSTAEFLAQRSALPVTTIELNERFFAYSKWRLRDVNNVRLIHGDSIHVLHSIAERTAGFETTFFYLDAHWEQHLPLRQELSEVARWDRWVALIDDFEVPDDPGYRFDDYGPDRRLTLDYLELGSLPSVATFWPSTPSAKEGGARRGCVVISSETLAPTLDRLSLLRSHSVG